MCGGNEYGEADFRDSDSDSVMWTPEGASLDQGLVVDHSGLANSLKWYESNMVTCLGTWRNGRCSPM